ncbi:MAG: ABC transporter permease subunit [Candidatus Dormibacteria bacterium]
MHGFSDLLIALLLSLPFVGAYSMFGLGIVTIYRASRVLNLAHGGIAMFPAFVVYALAVQHAWNPYLALLVGVLSGGLMAVATEVLLVRRLRQQGPTAQTVGTVAVLGLSIAIAAKVWGTTGLKLPAIFPGTTDQSGHTLAWRIGNGQLAYGKAWLFFTSVVVAGLVFALFRYTSIGLAMRGAADNRRAASLMGIDPDFVTSVAWLLGGSMAALGGILLASVGTLSPYTLSFQAVPAFVAALLGGLESLPGVLVGATVVGVVTGLVPLLPFGDQNGAAQLVLGLVAFCVMALRGRRFTGASDVKGELSGGAEPAGRRPRWLPAALILAVVVFPWLPGVPNSVVGTAGNAWVYGIVAVSLVLLTGWVGQISLAQAALVGIGAFFTGLLVRRGIPGLGFLPAVSFPFSLPIAALVTAGVAALLGMVALRVRGLYLAVATLIFAWMADSYLFQSQWLVGEGGASRIPPQVIGVAGSYPYLDFFNNRYAFYYAALGVLLTAFLLAANLRDSKTGRAFFALRGSEMAAASLGIDITRYKLLAFAVAGFLAGLAGNLYQVSHGTVVPDAVQFTVSLFFLSMVVVGGLQSLGGAIFAAALFAALDEVFFRGFLGVSPDQLAGWLDIVTAGLLAAVLLLYPNGLAALPRDVRRLLERRVPEAWRTGLARARAQMGDSLARATNSPRRRISALAGHLAGPARSRLSNLSAGLARPPRVEGTVTLADRYRARAVGLGVLVRFVGLPLREPVRVPDVLALAFEPGSAQPLERDTRPHLTVIEGGPESFSLPPHREDRRLVLEADHVTVRFGGLVAVDDVSLAVREHEIVGLIGPNGAGKTTTFNAVSGLNEPSSGQIRLFGEDVTRLGVHQRARLGLGRTFQVIQLFPQLDVFDNLMVATHLRNPSGFLSQVALTRGAVENELSARDRVRRVIRLLDLESVAQRPVTDLPFGVLRMVEVARVMVTGAPVIMLDEPASGLDNTETDRLAEFLQFIRAGLGVTLLLIEHDVQMVTRVCDYIYVLDRGALLAHGPSEQVQRDPSVVAAYLGEPASASA